MSRFQENQISLNYQILPLVWHLEIHSLAGNLQGAVDLLHIFLVTLLCFQGSLLCAQAYPSYILSNSPKRKMHHFLQVLGQWGDPPTGCIGNWLCLNTGYIHGKMPIENDGFKNLDMSKPSNLGAHPHHSCTNQHIFSVLKPLMGRL